MPQIIVTFNPSLDKLGKSVGSVDIKGTISEIINKLSTQVVGYGKQLAPVDTGYMRSRITQTAFSSPQSLRAVIEAGAHYSIYVHEGTRYMRARPFLEEGAKFATQNIAGNLSGRLEEKFVRAFKTL
jgi:HK97 gp10 family phage protein